MTMVTKIQSLTGGVDKLTKSADALLAKLTKINEVAGKSMTAATGALNAAGGQLNLAQGSSMNLGVNNARFPATAQSTGGGGNSLSGSMGGFSYMPQTPGQVGLNVGTQVINGVLGAVPDLGSTMQNALGYYQAGLKSPGINRAALERSTIGAMKGGFSSTLGGSITAGTLAASGYAPGSRNYLQAAGEVGRAYNYLGIDNQSAATALASMQSGSMGANLYQYGMTTYDPKTGKDKTMGQIAKELMTTMGGAGATTEQVRKSYQKGALGANLSTMGFDQTTQQMLYQAMIDISSGRNPDTNKPGKGNANTMLTAAGRMNASQAELMTSSEGRMIKGFENAADTVEAFNRALTNVIGPLAQLQGFVGGVKGTNLKEPTNALSNIFKTVTNFVLGRGGKGVGGGTNGFGAAFGKGGGKSGSAPVAGGVTAAYGAQDTSGLWSSTNNSHTGTDYNVPKGTPVQAAMAGVVSSVNLGADYGTSVMIDHPDGYQTIYAHLSEKQVKVGDTVAKGQRIGKSGDSGNASGAHLHFEVRQGKNNPVNPSELLGGGGSSDILNPYFTSILPTQNDVLGAMQSSMAGSSSGSGESIPADANVDLLDTLKKAGFTGSALATAYGIAKAESGGRSNAYNPRGKDLSYGLFQINMLGNLGPERLNKEWKTAGGDSFKLGSEQDLFDPVKNAQVAYHMSNGGKDWSHWTTYTSGKYKAFLDKGARGGGGYGTAFPVAPEPTGYTASVPAGITGGNNNTVNVTLKIDKASDEEAERFARKVTAYLQNGTEISMMGSS
jgi:murein DD-endopeptidase MepM/ murein hydrolase activator NlpD